MKNVRIPLPVLAPATPLVECTVCAKCCTYVGVGINAPTTPRLATDVLWYLYHEAVSVYLDVDGEWSVLFDTRCKQLSDHKLCGIYEDRPHVCRAFDNRSCDVNAPSEKAITFREPAEFLEWLGRKRPRLLAKIERGFVPGRGKRAARRNGPRADTRNVRI